MIFSFIVGIAVTVIIFIILKLIDEEKKKYELISREKKDEWKRN
jgi:capsular polysaccharide biosynthesis protein